MLSRGLCSALVQPLFCKQSLRIHPNPPMFRISQLNPHFSLGSFRAVRGSNVMYSSAAEPFSNIWRPFLFTMGVSHIVPQKLEHHALGFAICSTSLVVASVWRYENLVEQHNLHKAFGIDKFWNNKKVYVSPWERQTDEWREVWNSLTKGKQLFVGILGVNLLVLLAWAVPRLQPKMLRLFTVNIHHTGLLCWPLLFATFSHASVLHLGANMYALHSIIEGAVQKMGLEQFAGFYVSSGVIAAFCSYVWLVATKSAVSSLGASGAVLAVFGYMCTEYPDLRLNIIFLPMINFDGDIAVKSIIAISLAGVIFRWGVIDHMAHLCGVLCGVVWSSWGNALVWEQRKPIVDFWKEIRPSVLEK